MNERVFLSSVSGLPFKLEAFQFFIMPNFLKMLFRRKPTDNANQGLVEQHASKGRRGKKQQAPRKVSKRAVTTGESTTSTAKTQVVANKTPVKNVNTDLSPTNNSNDPPGKNRTSVPRKSPTTTSTSILHNSAATPYEVAHSTTSTAKTSDRDSPTFGVEDADHPTKPGQHPRHSPKMVNGSRKQEVSPGSQRVLSPRNTSAAASPPSRSSGPVDLDSPHSGEENVAVRRPGNSAIPVFTIDGGPGSATASQLLNKQAEDLNDDASSFNLSTDAEDTEYENMKRNVVAPSALDQSVGSTYNADADTSVFPNLIEEETPTGDGKDFAAAWDTNSPMHDFPASGAKASAGNISGFPSPPEKSKSSSSFFKSSQPTHEQQNTKAAQSPASDPFEQDTFADFADFANFDSNWGDTTGSSQGKSRSQSTSRAGGSSSRRSATPTKNSSVVYIDTGKLGRSESGNERGASAASMSTRETSLTELLAQAKSKSTRKSTTGSVNSAPVQSSYRRRDGSSVPLKVGSRSIADGGNAASVSDIIQNLDKAAKTRDAGSVKSVKSAKDRLKKRRQQKETDESDEAGESWLFDEVTGALGPRGIAADLESLSGRSHTSGGGRSHKSHRSTKSKRRSRRASSGESVGSKDSKRSNTSRRSRSSRYSHRSTRSYISQMSEQSRSVANDLLRLEMQLAMVGQQQSQPGQPSGSGAADDKSNPGDGHRSSRSRASAKSSHRSGSSARRSRITVMAPPGKLGIILANKADSKGTVVSGVRTSSVLAEKISPGDRIVAIDGEDVSLMTVSEITTIMARKADFERTLTVLTAPRSVSTPGH